MTLRKNVINQLQQISIQLRLHREIITVIRRQLSKQYFKQKLILVGLTHLAQKIDIFGSNDCYIGGGCRHSARAVATVNVVDHLCRVKTNCQSSVCIKAYWGHFQQVY